MVRTPLESHPPAAPATARSDFANDFATVWIEFPPGNPLAAFIAMRLVQHELKREG